jgi:hypothetical protein
MRGSEPSCKIPSLAGNRVNFLIFDEAGILGIHTVISFSLLAEAGEEGFAEERVSVSACRQSSGTARFNLHTFHATHFEAS